MRAIASEHLEVMSEPSSNFAYAAVTESITNSRGNDTQRREDVQLVINKWSYHPRVSNRITAVTMTR